MLVATLQVESLLLYPTRGRQSSRFSSEMFCVLPSLMAPLEHARTDWLPTVTATWLV